MRYLDVGELVSYLVSNLGVAPWRGGELRPGVVVRFLCCELRPGVVESCALES